MINEVIIKADHEIMHKLDKLVKGIDRIGDILLEINEAVKKQSDSYDTVIELSSEN